MPIPFLLGAAATITAGALGIGAHASAKETNKKAEDRVYEAKQLFDNAKYSLDNAQKKTEESLLKLGYSKKNVLETSINQFLTAYDRIKNIELSDSVGLEEIKNFSIEKQDALELKKMSDIYESSLSSSAAGATAGVVVALAASGYLPVVTGAITTTGAALAAGQFGAAATLASSTLSFAATITPLAAIAAPVALFTGISASIKADENLSKADEMYAKAELAAEKMHTSKVLCHAISDRADMFDNLLGELNGMFSQCTALLDGVTRSKMGFLKKSVDAKTLSKDELKLVAVTRALAGAVKAVIDTPILTSEGQVSEDSQTIYDETNDKLSAFADRVDEVNNCNFSAKPIKAVAIGTENQSSESVVRNTLAIVFGLCGYFLAQKLIINSFPIGLLAFSIVTLLVMNNDTNSNVFKCIKHVCCGLLGISFLILFWKACPKFMAIISIKSVIIDIVIGVVAFKIGAIFIPEENKRACNFRVMVAKLSACITFFAGGLLLYAVLHGFLGLSSMIAAIVTTIIYGVFITGSVQIENRFCDTK